MRGSPVVTPPWPCPYATSLLSPYLNERTMLTVASLLHRFRCASLVAVWDDDEEEDAGENPAVLPDGGSTRFKSESERSALSAGVRPTL